MGDFQKEQADIPNCVRLNYPVPVLSSERHLTDIQSESINSKKTKSIRKKWFLYGRDERFSDILDKWPELDDFICSFPCEKVKQAHISMMPPNEFLNVHLDGFGVAENYRPQFDLFNGTVRIHVPLQTSEKSFIYSAGLFYKMKRRECWMLNNFRQHSALNMHSDDSRFHLIIDVVPNSETFALIDGGDKSLGKFFPSLMKTLRSGDRLTKNKRPDFFVLGAMKSGTTSFYEYIRQHPDIVPAAKKELHYYDHKIHGEWDHEEYLKQFPSKKRNELSFEGSVYYLRHPHAPRWIKRDFPLAKFAALLRNPVERAYSHYQQKAVKGKELRSFEECVKNEEAFIGEDWAEICRNEKHTGRLSQGHSYLARGRYAEQIENWLNYFPRNRFHFILTDDMGKNPAKTLDEFFQFLGVPSYNKLDVGYRVKTRQYDPMSPEIRSWLEDYFEPHNQALERLLGQKISW